MGMGLKLNIARGIICLIALGVFLVSVLFTRALILKRPPAAHLPPSQSSSIEVNTLTISRNRQPIRFNVYGESRANRTIELRAPFSGRLVASPQLFAGALISANTPLFSLETTRLETLAKQLDVQNKTLNLSRARLQQELTILDGRLKTNGALLSNALEGLERQRENLHIRDQLYQRSRQLQAQNALSETELLEEEARLKSAQLAIIEATKAIDQLEDAKHLLYQAQNSIHYELATLPQQERNLKAQMEEISSDLAKASIQVEFPSQVVELLVEQEQEVQAGTVLAKIRSRQYVDIDAHIPDTQFNWLYGPDGLLAQWQEKNIIEPYDIQLVNQRFPRQFSGAKLKAIGSNVSAVSRALPITFTRKNPVNSNGDIQALDELKPGMYCQVTLTLNHASNAFLIPHNALHDQNLLYAIDSEGKVMVYQGIELLYEGPDGLVVDIPDAPNTIMLIVERLPPHSVGLLAVPRTKVES